MQDYILKLYSRDLQIKVMLDQKYIFFKKVIE